MTQSICFWWFIGGTIGMVLRSHTCHLDGSLAEPTPSAAWGYRTAVQMWSAAADKFHTHLIHGPACLKLRRCWTEWRMWAFEMYSALVSVPLQVQPGFKALKSAAHSPSLQTKLMFIPILHFYPEKFSLYASNWESFKFHCLMTAHSLWCLDCAISLKYVEFNFWA